MSRREERVRRSVAGLLVLAVLLSLAPLGGLTAWAQADPVINEFVFNHTGTDTEAFIEVVGDPSTDYSALTVLEIEGDSSGAGVIDAVLPVGGTDTGGYWIDDEDVENGTVTLLLVENFGGSMGTDLDAGNDGVLDDTPWSRIVDDVAVSDGGSSDRTYASVVLTRGYDGNSYTVGGASRIPNGADTDTVGDWVRNDFDGAGFPGFTGTPNFGEALNTPLAENEEATPAFVELTIMEIQADGQYSPYDGAFVRTTGIVTLLTADGRDMWIQDPVGDGDPSTSDGILVDDRDRLDPPPQVGDLVSITAFVEEQQFYPALPRTRLNDPWPPFFEIISSGNTLPEPIPLVDLPNLSMPDGEWFWEPLEGMRVSIENGFVASATSKYGEFGMLTEADADADLGSGYYANTKQMIIRGLGMVGDDYAVDYNPERIVVDDVTLDDAIMVQPGDRVRSLVGVVDYTFSMYKLQPDTFDVKAHKLAKLPVSTRSGGFGNAAITTYNVENLFGDASDTQLSKLSLAIQVELELPEIIVVQEIENTAILQTLGDWVNAAAGTSYAAVSFDTSDARGIEVGFLWDDNRVDLLDAYQMSGPDVEAWFGPDSPSPGREPLVGLFDIHGYQVTIIGNHFKSKGGDDPLYGVNWPPNRVTEYQRRGQAQTVRNFVNTILAADPGALVMVAGDLNDFQFSEPGEGADNPLAILEGVGSEIPLTNLINLEEEPERFTYLYDGNSQVLDHILVSPGLYDFFQGVDVLHFNTTTPTPVLEDDASSPLSSSDHDPVESRFQFK
jgi:predicted extracellular nuclease